MASTPETKLRIATSVLFATGFFDAIAGRFVYEPRSFTRNLPETDTPVYRDLAGAVHIHSNYSDGAGDVPTVMEAACESGVDWVLLTDHNTQRPLRDGWEERYNARPLLLIGTEVTVEHGAFLLALDMPAAWEPTRDKTPQDAIDEVNEHGGLPLVSLPFDIKHPWREWDVHDCAGLEVINVSTIARRHINLLSLIWLTVVTRTAGMSAALRALLTRPDAALARWDSLTAQGKPSVGIGALDAHALMKIGKKKYPYPSYTETMRVATTHALIPPDTTDPRRAIYNALRAGHCYFCYDCLGDPRPLSYSGTNGTDVAIMGERIARRGNEPIRLTVNAPSGSLVRVYYQGQVVAAGTSGKLTHTVTESGAYRVEVYRYVSKLGPFYLGTRPWIFTNPIYVE